MLKVITVMGTRPEYIRLCKIIAKLDKVCDKHILVETGQSYDFNMAGAFITELGIRSEDYNMGAGVHAENPAEQIAGISKFIYRILDKEKPDRMLILGDTNSVKEPAYWAKRMGVRVYHMEAGNRCFDDRVPEEVNRRVIDTCSDILLPYTQNAKQNLLREGYPSSRILVTGNPIYEVIKGIDTTFHPCNFSIDIKKYFLVTLHRAENVSNPERLGAALDALVQLWEAYKLPIIFSCHPNTRAKIEALEDYNSLHIKRYPEIIIHEPFGLSNFLILERNALCVLSDSGTVQEECCIFGVPCVTLRDQTERQETLECGSNILAGVKPESVLRCVKTALSFNKWTPPSEYMDENVSEKVVRIVTGY
jgi:UDP-N-acetylglucosamine 2-epimerase (non-hydrolysing)